MHSDQSNFCQNCIDVSNHLKEIPPLTLIEKIRKFRNLNFSRMTDEEIGNAVLDVLLWKNKFLMFTNLNEYHAGNKFFRIKRLKGSMIPNERFNIYQDYWETNPKYIISYKRLNKPGESLLYLSPDISCCLDEVQIHKNDVFAVIQYTAKSNIKVNIIGGNYNYDRLDFIDDKAKVIHEIYNEFLRNEFSREVGIGTEHLYKVSEYIAKNYFDLPPREVQDAWVYPSVKDKTKYNICFRPEIAHELLELNGAMICKGFNIEPFSLNVCCVAIGADSNNSITFYPLGSDQQKSVFPDISL